MATAGVGPAELGARFVPVTGRSTVTDRQAVDVAPRLDDGTERTLAAYLDGAVGDDGPGDAVDDPVPA